MSGQAAGAANAGMKLVIAVVQESDMRALLAALRAAHIGATEIATGGFRRGATSTVLIGVPAALVATVRDLVIQHCGRRHRLHLPYASALDPSPLAMPERFDVEVGGAVLFVRSIVRFERL
jgi:uncharacterized protein YaaQ